MPARPLHNAAVSLKHPLASAFLLGAALLAGCATRSADIGPLQTDKAEFLAWSCPRIQDESEKVQRRAAGLAYDVDERLGNNVIALGVGVTIFWPALLAMRSDGLEAAELARLKGRFEALRAAAADHACPPAGPELPADRLAKLPVAAGERLVYEERLGPRGAVHESSLRVLGLRRDEIEYAGDAAGAWKQDLAGNLFQAPAGRLQWQHLLRHELELGQVLAGEFMLAGDPLVRARVRGQVVAVGPQTVAGRGFDAAVVELFGDAMSAEASTRLDGVIVVDRHSGVLLRLDLRSAMAPFSLQRRLARVDAAP